jgi:hypothetical protein
VVAGRSSDYAGMSNDKTGENPVRRKPKVSWGREIRPGLAGTLVEAERRRRWIAGQHSCAAAVNRWRDGTTKESDRLEVVVGHFEAGDWKIRPVRQGMHWRAFTIPKDLKWCPRKSSKG